MNVAFRFTTVIRMLAASCCWLVFSVPLDSNQHAEAADDEAIIAAIEEFGGTVKLVPDANEQEWEVEFHLHGRDLTDEGLETIAALKRIVSLNLRDTKITGEGLVHLQGLGGLRELHLERTEVGDAAIANLAGLNNLEYLNLYSTNITDKSLEHLMSLKKLKRLYVWQTGVTDAGIERLQQQLPDLKIVRGVDLDKLPQYAEIVARKPEPEQDLKWIAVNLVSEAPKSKNGINTLVLFENKSGQRVKLFWVSYGNELKLYATLEPDMTREQNSYAGNTWLITDETDNPLGYFVVTEEVSRAVIPSL